MTRRTEFFTELAALMEKHQVEMEVREECTSFQGCLADGIDFDFGWMQLDPTTDEERVKDHDGYTVTWEGRYFDYEVVAKLATKADSDK